LDCTKEEAYSCTHTGSVEQTRKLILPKFAWIVDKISGLARATYFTSGEFGTGKAEFSEPEEDCLLP
jgi:hypothetical protein